MNRILILLTSFLISLNLSGQIKRATLLEDYTILVEETAEAVPPLNFRDEGFIQMDGFPKVSLANSTFKNFRNVTLADLDKDGVDDILWGADNVLYAHTFKELLWEHQLSSTAIYPPSVADIDGNGSLEIVQATGGSQSNSSIYFLNFKGQDRTNWPLSFDGHWILTAPALSDLDNDGEMEIIFNERDDGISRIHVVNRDGQPFSENWPIAVVGTLAITPSIGDVDQDGEKEIFVATTNSRYLFKLNGDLEEGWPQDTGPDQKYSFQSPLLVDLNQDNNLEIIGATHGDEPEYYVLQADGSNFPGWPKPVPENSWTFTTPTLISTEGALQFFMSRPIDDRMDDMLFGWNDAGNPLMDFPISKSGGLEGIISVADVDDDGEYELLFGSNQLLPDGTSFIHAYEMDGTETPGFPIRPYGWTFMNGINIGDINGDQKMDLIALTYTQNFDQNLTDSVYLNVYELNTPYSPERVLWNTYKGDNTRDGLVFKQDMTTSVKDQSRRSKFNVKLHPNPVDEILKIQLTTQQPIDINLKLYNSQGQLLESIYSGSTSKGMREWTQNVQNLPAGMYFLRSTFDQQSEQILKFIKF